MLRGRIVAANGIKAEDLKPGEGSALGAARRPRHHLCARASPQVRAWSPAHGGRPIIPARRWCRWKTARRKDLSLKLGDTITVNVLGRNMTARIANLRAVDWQSLGINFVLVFSPGTFGGAPHTDIATLTFADGGTTAEDTALIRSLADAFPMVSAVRVKDALDAIDHIVGNLVLALRGASTVTLIAAALVLGGALAAGQRFRVYDAVVLKTLGATRARLIAAYAMEYLLIGLADRGVRRCGRLARRRPRGDAADGVSLRLRGRRGRRRGARWRLLSRWAWGSRHFRGARPQARGSTAEPLIEPARPGR